MVGPDRKKARVDMATPVSKSFVKVDEESHFPLQNLPYGVFSTEDTTPRVGVRLGMNVVDLDALGKAGVFKGICDAALFSETALNKFMAAGRPVWKAVRARLLDVLSESGDTVLRGNGQLTSTAIIPVEQVTMHLPAHIGDYTDFYASKQHATNVGIMFRGVDNALQPNWLHLPVGYHGRASSVVVSGTQVRRPCGQLNNDPDMKKPPTYGACQTLDFELEIGMFVGGPPTELGEPIHMKEVDDHVFGFVLLNDWSARDIQKWEYVPLGPFGAKNFCTSISPWVVTAEALEPFKCPTSVGKQDDPLPLPYLIEPGYSSYNIDLRVLLKAEDIGPKPVEISHSNFRNMYWTHRQQLVHHTVTGCNMNPGDLLGSGTISGDDLGTYGSMLELCWKGTKPIKFESGAERKFLRDGDMCIITGVCQGPGYKVGFGEVEGTILPARPQLP